MGPPSDLDPLDLDWDKKPVLEIHEMQQSLLLSNLAIFTSTHIHQCSFLLNIRCLHDHKLGYWRVYCQLIPVVIAPCHGTSKKKAVANPWVSAMVFIDVVRK